jgi:putative NADH-flavin reductase
MNIALIGASGFAGSALLEEALGRGHRATALAVRPDGTPSRRDRGLWSG